MAKTRYEEYEHGDRDLPFTLLIDIKRSPLKFSEEANWHDALEIEWFKKGAGVAMINGEGVNASSGDAIVVNSYEIHRLIPTDELVYTCLIIDLKFCRQAGIDPTGLDFTRKIDSGRLNALMAELEDIYTKDEDCRTAKLLRTVLDIIILLKSENCVSRREQKERLPAMF
ncbi:MAG: AraC family ligand binding domain-containing protein, partial [Clostridia bacterium]|nr:AraC family ligand binding domain-containing protein [Clostridia bacterium]